MDETDARIVQSRPQHAVICAALGPLQSALGRDPRHQAAMAAAPGQTSVRLPERLPRYLAFAPIATGRWCRRRSSRTGRRWAPPLGPCRKMSFGTIVEPGKGDPALKAAVSRPKQGNSDETSTTANEKRGANKQPHKQRRDMPTASVQELDLGDANAATQSIAVQGFLGNVFTASGSFVRHVRETPFPITNAVLNASPRRAEAEPGTSPR